MPRWRAAVARPLRAGQASVELVAGLPALLLSGFVALQLLAVGYCMTLADGAAEAGAIAVAAGRPAVPAARQSLPGWSRNAVRVTVRGGRVTVRVRPPSLFASLGDRLAVSSSAWARGGLGS
jgi:hypothetical protein